MNDKPTIKILSYLLYIYWKKGKEVDQYVFQKMLYLIEWWSITLLGKENSIVWEQFEWWVNWPVSRNAWMRFSKNDKSISFSLSVKEQNIKKDKDALKDFSLSQQMIIKWVIKYYSKYTAPELIDMTHEHPAWLTSRTWLLPTQSWSKGISLDDMIATFSVLPERENIIDPWLLEESLYADNCIADIKAGRFVTIEK